MMGADPMTDTPTPDDIARWAALAESATPGPWLLDSHAHFANGCRCMSCDDDPTVWNTTAATWCEEQVASTPNDFGRERGRCEEAGYVLADAEFIAAARDALPRLLALVAAQAEQNAELCGEVELHDAYSRADTDTAVAAVQRAERAEAELSAFRATDEYQRWARAVTERDAAREQVAAMRGVVDAVLAQALIRRSLPDTRRAIENVRDEIRAALEGGVAT